MGSITVTDLGKAYKNYPTRWSRFIEWLDHTGKTRHKLHWVLKGINFNISPGEAVGIIGVNGAGKTTLLKMITGTTQPTSGSVEVNGRVAALLELGMGFHPDFTGRQNVYMAGQLLGYSTEEVAALMNEIEDFAEIGEYIDQPIRVYSSGMQVRLAFSVATMVRPDILIVDEALAVGDTYFQHKCTERIRSYLSKGTTLLFVSHSPGALKALCGRAIMLANGTLVREGLPDEVIDYYNALNAKRTDQYYINIEKTHEGKKRIRSGTGDALIGSADMIVNGISSRVITSGSEVEIVLVAKIVQPVMELSAGVLVRDRYGNDVWGTNSSLHGVTNGEMSVGEVMEFHFKLPNLYLGPGSYSISAALHLGKDHLSGNFDWIDQMLIFNVVDDATPGSTGICKFPVFVSTTPKIKTIKE